MSDVLARMRDRLEINAPYNGIVAEGYDAWMPVDEPIDEEPAYRHLLERIDGTVLELGCGTGRPLLRWLAEGYDVEGVDAAGDMLALLAQHAAARGLRPTVHRGDIAPLDLGRRYAAIFGTAGTFSLVRPDERAREAIASYAAHLQPGGTLAITGFVPTGDLDAAMEWRVRRTGTTAAGETIAVHEAVACDRDAKEQIILNKIERYGVDGGLLETVMRRIHLRWWPRDEFSSLLEEAGFGDIRFLGDDDGYVCIGRLPR